MKILFNYILFEEKIYLNMPKEDFFQIKFIQDCVEIGYENISIEYSFHEESYLDMF